MKEIPNQVEEQKSIGSWPDGRLIMAIGLLYALIQLMTFIRSFAIFRLDGEPIILSEMIPDRVVGWVIGFIYIIIIVKTTKYLLTRSWSWVRIFSIHLVFAILISLVWYLSFIEVATWFCTTDDCLPQAQEFWYWYLVNFDKLFLLYVLTVSITYTYYYVRRDDLNRYRQAQMETKLLQARMKMLRSQLHPHFLFNTLNSITSLIDIDIQKAKTVIADLADLLRKVLDWRDQQYISLREELELLQRYVDIEKTRFSDDLTIDWKIDEAALDTEVPAMLLQPLVENAIHHGFSGDHLHVKMLIEAARENGHLILRVSDDGQGFPESKNILRSGTGIRNTHERLETLYGDRFRLDIRNTSPGVVSEIAIPMN